MAVVSTLVSIAITVAVAVGMRLISSLLSPQQSKPYGGQLQQAKDPGTQVTVRSADQPHQIVFGQRRVAGNITFVHTTANNYYLHLVVVWAGHEVEELGALYFNDEEVPLSGGAATGKYQDLVWCSDHLGSPDQEADAALISACPDKWTVEHRGRGVAYSYILLAYDRDKYPQGLPNIWRVVKGKKVYDPRDDTTAWSDNAALCTAAWLADPKYGRGQSYADMDLDALSTAANACDETIELAGGGAEKRYACDAVLSSDVAFVDNFEKLLAAMHGTAALIGGKWVIDAAAWEEPALVLGEGDFLAPFTVLTGTGNASAFNAIKGKFRNPDKLWQPDDFPAIVSAAYEIEDGGDGNGLGREFKDVDLDTVKSPSQSQRLARIDLRLERQPISFTGRFRLKALRLRAGNNVGIDFAPLGWAAKPFRVERLRLILGFAPGSGGGSDSQQGIIGVELDLRETAEAIYAWDPALDEIGLDPARNTDLPNVFDPLAPASLEVEEEKYVTRDGAGVKTRAVLTWPSSLDAFVTAYRVMYRAPGADAWIAGASIAAFSARIDDLAPGTWEFGVQSVNTAGVASAVTTRTRSITGLADIPGDVGNFHVTPLGGAAVLHFDATVDVDVRIGGRLVVKHSPATSGATWDTAVSIGRVIPGNSTSAIVPLKAGTLLARWQDSTGQQSANVAEWVTKQATSLAYANLATLDEAAGGFAGAKTDVSVVSAKLQVDMGVTEGVYAFDDGVDLGAVTRCRVTTFLEAQISDPTDLWDSTELCDSPESWDSVVSGNEADAWVEVRETDDDPGGSPVWGPWHRVDAMEAEARAFEFRAVLKRSEADFTIELSGLGVAVDEVA